MGYTNVDDSAAYSSLSSRSFPERRLPCLFREKLRQALSFSTLPDAQNPVRSFVNSVMRKEPHLTMILPLRSNGVS